MRLVRTGSFLTAVLVLATTSAAAAHSVASFDSEPVAPSVPAEAQLAANTSCQDEPRPPVWFSYVNATSTFCVPIAWMASTGITEGRGDGTFGVGAPVTRGAMAAFLYRFADEPSGPFNATEFSDVAAGHVFATPVAWMASEGITLGRGDGTFGLHDPVTRGAMAAFLYRFADEPAIDPDASPPALVPAPTDEPLFVTTWDLDNIFGNSIQLPFAGTVDVDIDWGDGTRSTGVSRSAVHTYASKGTYTVTVRGGFERYGAPSGAGGIEALVAVEAWGPTATTDLLSAFHGASNLVKVAEPPRSVRRMSSMLSGASSFNQPVGQWDVANVTDLSNLFKDASSFNQPLANWNTSQVTDMSRMFEGASSFNQPIGAWDTSKVRTMFSMFEGASSFSQPIGKWDIRSVTTLDTMFTDATSFNQPIGAWDTSNVTTMRSMFSGAESFDQPIGGWDTSRLTTMNNLFLGASSFNQPIGGWDTSNVGDLDATFFGASSFDQPIGGWDTSSLTSMHMTFFAASSFNQDLSRWNVDRVYQHGSFDERADSWQDDFKPRFPGIW